MSKWIRADKRKPEKSGQYLVALKNRFDEYLIMVLSYDNNVYGWENHSHYFCKLTHWMELPEPPKED